MRTIVKFGLMISLVLLMSANLRAVTRIVDGTVAAELGVTSVTDEYQIGQGAWKNVADAVKFQYYVAASSLFPGGSVSVSQIARIDFWTKDGSLANPTGLDFYFLIYTAGNAHGWYGERLTSEPMYYNSLNRSTSEWNHWCTDAGTNQMTWFDSNYGPFGFYNAPTLAMLQSGPIDWSAYGGSGIVDYSGQNVLYFSLQTGSAWNSIFDGLLDNIVITLTDGRTVVMDLEQDSGPVHNITQSVSYHAIDAAVANASGDDIIEVDPGTYPTGIVTISVNLTIRASDTAGPPLLTPTTNTGGSGDARGWFLVQDGVTGNFDHLDFDGSGYNIFTAIRHKGLGGITSCSFGNVRYGTYLGFGIMSFGAHPVTVENCVFFNIERVGTHFFGATATPRVYRGNIHTGNGVGNYVNYGLELGGGATALVVNNAITNCRGVAATDGSTSAGVLVTDYFAPGTAGSFTGNVFTGNTAGVHVGYLATDASVVNITESNVAGNEYGVYNGGAVLAEATANWWGSVDGPDLPALLSAEGIGTPFHPEGGAAAERVTPRRLDASGIDGLIHYSPWVAAGGDDADGVLPGWQPDLSVVGVSTNGTIQEGIDLVSGSTVNIAAGTYEEQLHITTGNLNLVGAGVGATTVRSPATLPLYFVVGGANRKPVVFIDGATGVSISALTVDGYGRGNANSSFQGVAFWNAGGSLTNVDIVDVRDTPFSGAQHGVALYVNNNTPAGSYEVNLTDVAVSGFQKNAMSCYGANTTVNGANIAVTGAGATGVTAQNGMQYTYGAGGTLVNCDISGIAYTGAGWTACDFLLFQAGTVNMSGCDILDAQTGVYFYDTDGAFSGGSVTATSAATPEPVSGIYIYSTGAALSLPGRRPSMLADEPPGYDRRGNSLDADEVVAVTNAEVIGSGGALSEGITAYVDGGNVNVTLDNCNVSGWSSGVTLFGTGAGTIATAGLTNSFLDNTSNVSDNVTGHTYANNCYSDFASNPGFPLTYNVPGGAGNVDYTPRTDCANINLVVSSNLVGCGAACSGENLYLTFDGIGYLAGQMFVDLPEGLDAAWPVDATYPGAPHIVYPSSNQAANLQAMSCVARRTAANVIEVNTQWAPPYSNGDSTKYIAEIPLTATGAHGTGFTVTLSNTYTFWTLSGPVDDGFTTGVNGYTVDCDAPAAALTGGVPDGCNAYGTEASFANALHITMSALGSAGLPVSPLTSATITLGATTWTLPLADGTFPGGSETPNVWAMMTEGCNAFTLTVTDAECNTVTTSQVEVVKDVSASEPAIYYMQSACYNNIAGDPQFGAAKLVNDLEIDLDAALACQASTFSLAFTVNGTPVTAGLTGVASIADYPTEAQAVALWTDIAGVLGASWSGAVTLGWSVTDCAGNAASGSIPVACIDFVPASNTFSRFNARPTDMGVWLDWEWNYDANSATAVEIYRAPEGTYPTYGGQLWNQESAYHKVHSTLSGWTLVATQAGPNSTSALYGGTHGGPGNAFWKDVDPTWTTAGDDNEARDIYRYITFVRDAAGNWSEVGSYTIGANADRSTNYWLGDFSMDVVNDPDGSSGSVGTADLTLLSGVYFTPVTASNDQYDIGPENAENGYGKGIPMPNNGYIDFSDLVPFSFNFGVAGPSGFSVPVPRANPEAATDMMPVVSVARTNSNLLEVGSEFDVVVTLSGNGSSAVKAIETGLVFDPTVLEVVNVIGSAGEVYDGVAWSSAKQIPGRDDRVGIAAAAMGHAASFVGDFTAATVTFRWINDRSPATSLAIESYAVATVFGQIWEGEGAALGIGATGAIPTQYALHQNYPNPFNPSTTIRFDLPENADVTLVIYNVVGQEVRTLVSGSMPAGAHSISWNGLDNGGHEVGSGMYLYRISAGPLIDIRKMLLTR